MILKLFIQMLSNTFFFLGTIVFPTLPAAVNTYFQYFINYVSQAMSLISIFLDIPYVSSLLGWWISLGALILVVELFMWVWKAITGNISNEYVSESVDENGDLTVRRSGLRRGAVVKTTKYHMNRD